MQMQCTSEYQMLGMNVKGRYFIFIPCWGLSRDISVAIVGPRVLDWGVLLVWWGIIILTWCVILTSMPKLPQIFSRPMNNKNIDLGTQGLVVLVIAATRPLVPSCCALEPVNFLPFHHPLCWVIHVPVCHTRLCIVRLSVHSKARSQRQAFIALFYCPVVASGTMACAFMFWLSKNLYLPSFLFGICLEHCKPSWKFSTVSNGKTVASCLPPHPFFPFLKNFIRCRASANSFCLKAW